MNNAKEMTTAELMLKALKAVRFCEGFQQWGGGDSWEMELVENAIERAESCCDPTNDDLQARVKNLESALYKEAAERDQAIAEISKWARKCGGAEAKLDAIRALAYEPNQDEAYEMYSELQEKLRVILDGEPGQDGGLL